MPGTRKLSRVTSHRSAMLNNLVSSLILNGKIETTLAKAKEVKPIADSLVDLAIKEKDNFEEVDAKVVVAKKDAKGNKETEIAKSKNGKKYEVIVREVVKENKNVDKPSKLAARKKMFRHLNKISDFNGNTVDLTEKLFNVIAPRYAKRNGGYTQIIKKGPRRGDSAETVILKLV